MTLDEYVARVKTGQDLIDAGVIPKDSSTHLALIALKRLEAIRDHLLANINEEVLGMWLPAVDQKSFEVGQFVTSQDIIKKYAKEGMRIRANNQDSLEGTIKDTRRISEGWLVIEYDRNIQDGSTMNGMCASGRGAYAKIDQIGLIVPGGKITEGYTLAEGVVADEQLGHKLRFGSDFRGEIYDTNFYKLGEAEIPKHTKAKLEAFFDSRSDSLQLLLDENLKGLGNRKRIVIPGEQLYSNLQVSSLGQLEPKDKEMEVRKQTLMDFLPKTVLDSERAERIITGLLMAKDMILYGPPGGGKTNVANDIIDIAMQQEAIFIVDGCQAQCNPYSLFDESFAKVVPPCPECMIKYDPHFKGTGIFKRPKPADVKVVVAKYGEGIGIEHVAGTIGLDRMHLVGYKIPRLDGTTTPGRESDSDPEGFRAGKLIRTNNGVFHMDEMDKMRIAVLDCILEAADRHTVKPDELRHSYPSNQEIIGTANDQTVFSAAINDRMLLLAVRYPDDVDTSYDITRSTYHKEALAAGAVKIEDTHKLRGNGLRSAPIPVFVEKAVDAFYIKFRAEYSGAGKTEISGSNRSKFDALDAARAKWNLDKLFFKSTQPIPDSDYALYGIEYALCTRVQEPTEQSDKDAKQEIIKWVKEQFPELVKQEENKWWCDTYTHLAILETKVPDIVPRFNAEIDFYKRELSNSMPAFRKVLRAQQNPRDSSAQQAAITNPFMYYLFSEQPQMAKLYSDETQLAGLIDYFMKSHARFAESRKNDNKG